MVDYHSIHRSSSVQVISLIVSDIGSAYMEPLLQKAIDSIILKVEQVGAEYALAGRVEDLERMRSVFARLATGGSRAAYLDMVRRRLICFVSGAPHEAALLAALDSNAWISDIPCRQTLEAALRSENADVRACACALAASIPVGHLSGPMIDALIPLLGRTLKFETQTGREDRPFPCAHEIQRLFQAPLLWNCSASAALIFCGVTPSDGGCWEWPGMGILLQGRGMAEAVLTCHVRSLPMEVLEKLVTHLESWPTAGSARGIGVAESPPFISEATLALLGELGRCPSITGRVQSLLLSELMVREKGAIQALQTVPPGLLTSETRQGLVAVLNDSIRLAVGRANRQIDDRGEIAGILEQLPELSDAERQALLHQVTVRRSPSALRSLRLHSTGFDPVNSTFSQTSVRSTWAEDQAAVPEDMLGAFEYEGSNWALRAAENKDPQGQDFLDWLERMLQQGFSDGYREMRYFNSASKYFDALSNTDQSDVRVSTRERLLVAARQKSSKRERNMAVKLILNLGGRIIDTNFADRLFAPPTPVRDEERLALARNKHWDVLEQLLQECDGSQQNDAEHLVVEFAREGSEQAYELCIDRLKLNPVSQIIGEFMSDHLRRSPLSLGWIMVRAPEAFAENRDMLTVCLDIVVEERIDNSEMAYHLGKKLEEVLRVTRQHETARRHLIDRFTQGHLSTIPFLSTLDGYLSDEVQEELCRRYESGVSEAGDRIADSFALITPQQLKRFRTAVLRQTVTVPHETAKLIAKLPAGFLKDAPAHLTLLLLHLDTTYDDLPVFEAFAEPYDFNAVRSLIIGNADSAFRIADDFVICSLLKRLRSADEFVKSVSSVCVYDARLLLNEKVGWRFRRGLEQYPAAQSKLLAILLEAGTEGLEVVATSLDLLTEQTLQDLRYDMVRCQALAEHLWRKMESGWDRGALHACFNRLPLLADKVVQKLEQSEAFPPWLYELPSGDSRLRELLRKDLETAVAAGSGECLRAPLWQYIRVMDLPPAELLMSDLIRTFPDEFKAPALLHSATHLRAPTDDEQEPLNPAEGEVTLAALAATPATAYRAIQNSKPSQLDERIVPHLISTLQQGGEGLVEALELVRTLGRNGGLSEDIKQATLEGLPHLARQISSPQELLSQGLQLVRICTKDDWNVPLLGAISSSLFEFNKVVGAETSFNLLSEHLGKTALVKWLAIYLCHHEGGGGYPIGRVCPNYLAALMPAAESAWLARWLAALDSRKDDYKVRNRLPTVVGRMPFAALDAPEMLQRIYRMAEAHRDSEEYTRCVKRLEASGIRFFRRMSGGADLILGGADEPPAPRFYVRSCVDLAADPSPISGDTAPE